MGARSKQHIQVLIGPFLSDNLAGAGVAASGMGDAPISARRARSPSQVPQRGVD